MQKEFIDQREVGGRHDQRWEVLASDEEETIIAPVGGGAFNRSLKTEVFERYFVEAPMPVWHKRLFSCGDDAVVVPGFTDGRRWNGWHVPFFELDEAGVMAKHVSSQDGTGVLISCIKPIGDQTPYFVEIDQDSRTLGDTPEQYTRYVKPIEIEVDGSKHLVYQIGDGFTWEEFFP